MSGTVFGAAGVADGIFNPNCATAFDTQGSEPYRKPGDRHLVKLVFARVAAGTAAVGRRSQFSASGPRRLAAATLRRSKTSITRCLSPPPTVCNILARKDADRRGGGPRYELFCSGYYGFFPTRINTLVEVPFRTMIGSVRFSGEMLASNCECNARAARTFCGSIDSGCPAKDSIVSGDFTSTKTPGGAEGGQVPFSFVEEEGGQGKGYLPPFSLRTPLR